MDKFNFVYDGKHKPNYRVEYESSNYGTSVSSPAIFKCDNDAINAALAEFPKWKEIGLDVVKVLKYKRTKLTEIYRN